MGRPMLMLEPGQRNNSLTVLAHVGSMIPSKAAAFLVRCDCGTEFVEKGSRFRTGDVKSCGCRKHRQSANHTHGQSGTDVIPPTVEYKTWLGMRARCTNPNATRYADYGGRGISICDRWSDFENFFADMGSRPSADHSIDRIDSNGNYEPGNCRWATDTVQGRNRRGVKLTEALVQEIKGRYEHGEGQHDIAARMGVGQYLVSNVIRGNLWKGVGEPVAPRKRRCAVGRHPRLRS